MYDSRCGSHIVCDPPDITYAGAPPLYNNMRSFVVQHEALCAGYVISRPTHDTTHRAWVMLCCILRMMFVPSHTVCLHPVHYRDVRARDSPFIRNVYSCIE